MIRKITRYAVRISERGSNSANRREEYYKVAGIFHQCKTIEDAHRFSAQVFGMEYPMHLKGDFQRETDSANSGVFEERPNKVIVMPRVRKYKEKYEKTAIADYSEEKIKDAEKHWSDWSGNRLCSKSISKTEDWTFQRCLK